MNVWVNGVSARLGGGVTYMQALVGSLARVAPENAYRLFVSPAMYSTFQTLANGRVDVAPVDGAGRSIVRRIWFEQVGLPGRGRTGEPALLLSPANVCSLRWPGPQVLVVQSIAPFLRDAQRNKNAWHRVRYPVLSALTRLSFKVADVVVTNSAASRSLLLEHGCPQEKLVVIPMGRTDIFSKVATASSGDPASGGGYLLTVGMVVPHKNLEVLIEAVGTLRTQGHEWPLKVVGPTPDSRYLAYLRQTVARRGVEDLVTFEGPVPYEQLPDLYHDAGCYVLPSLVENFPHTLVEAMSAGCPVVSSSQIPTREICGPAAVECDASDHFNVAGKVSEVMTDKALRQRMSSRGMERAERFDWKDVAREYLEVFRVAVQARGSRA